MNEDMMKGINQLFQEHKLLLNATKLDLDTAIKNTNKYETKMWNLEYEYSLYRRKKVFIQFKHYILMILTFGIHTILFRNKYYDEIEEVEENITENILDSYNLKRDINNNDISRILLEEILKIVKLEYEKLEFLLSLSDEEKQKYLNYKMGDSNASNKNS